MSVSGRDGRENDDAIALEPVPHGGNLAEAARLFPDAPLPWIDLSTGINPDSYPLPALPTDIFQRLPSPSALARLEAVARDSYGAPAGSAVLASAGTHPVLSALTRLYPRASVAVVGPTYAEHPHIWRQAGRHVETVSATEPLADADVGVIVRPNNPDGSFAPRDEMARLIQQMNRRLLIVDEAFVDLLPPGSSLIDSLPDANILILRSFGKTYGLAGVRLAFAIGRPPLIESLRAELGPWPVSGPAIMVGTAALSDKNWLSTARARASARSEWFVQCLAANGIRVSGDALLFHCVDYDSAAALFDHLGTHGIYVRRFADQPRRLRIGLPADDPLIKRRIETALASFPR